MSGPQLIWREARAAYLDAEAAALEEVLAALVNAEALAEEARDEAYLESLRPFMALTRERVSGRRSAARAIRTKDNGA